eukprot:g78440.t1
MQADCRPHSRRVDKEIDQYDTRRRQRNLRGMRRDFAESSWQAKATTSTANRSEAPRTMWLELPTTGGGGGTGGTGGGLGLGARTMWLERPRRQPARAAASSSYARLQQSYPRECSTGRYTLAWPPRPVSLPARTYHDNNNKNNKSNKNKNKDKNKDKYNDDDEDDEDEDPLPNQHAAGVLALSRDRPMGHVGTVLSTIDHVRVCSSSFSSQWVDRDALADLRRSLQDGGSRGRPGRLHGLALVLALRFLSARDLWCTCPNVCTAWYQLLDSPNSHLSFKPLHRQSTQQGVRSVRAFAKPQRLPAQRVQSHAQSRAAQTDRPGRGGKRRNVAGRAGSGWAGGVDSGGEATDGSWCEEEEGGAVGENGQEEQLEACFLSSETAEWQFTEVHRSSRMTMRGNRRAAAGPCVCPSQRMPPRPGARIFRDTSMAPETIQ